MSAPPRKRPRTSPPPEGAQPPAQRLATGEPSSAAPSIPSFPAVASSPATAPTPSASLSINPPSYYLSTPAPTFQLPHHLTSFSYSPTRELLLDPSNKDDALAWYREPRMGSDLNKGFGEAVWRNGVVDEGLDALVDTLSAWAARDSTGGADDVLSKVSVITWRGMMTKLMLAVYEAENAAKGRRVDGWEMNAMVLDGCLYIEESNPPSKLAAKAASESSNALASYYGYSFESFCTTSSSSPSAATEEFSVPNTNVQWCSVVKTSLGEFRTIVGGEVDCVRPGADKERIGTRDFVELKTNLVIQSQRDEVNFERHKLLKHYVQSFLLGVPTVTVGFRTRAGHLTGLQSFNTLDIPRLVRGKPHAWDPGACLASARSLLSFIHSTISSHPSTLSADEDYPVFRLTFDPSSRDGPHVRLRELSREEVRVEVLGAKREEERVGFLLRRWVEEVRERRGRVGERQNEARPATNGTPSSSAPSTRPRPSPPPPPPAPLDPQVPTLHPSRPIPPPPPPPPATNGSNGSSCGTSVRPPVTGVAAGLKR
ncbi:RHTO0S04e09472g1_1 [Rhodotorula toruloides]|uniref:Decapping nuclease n=2 Tax=Rhodotorula toruloides TaxID=5286 RepID=A0A061AWK3_RHOTO|nr:RAI1-like domain containing protein [Rhodotorula toruloides NP11]EMS19260.1 RAI1-like domain containing protein [Rhodotorula toruloides NP11]CDR39788.1 RHTO0S04e09472g1_1 [Rhodotorula toruloides]